MITKPPTYKRCRCSKFRRFQFSLLNTSSYPDASHTHTRKRLPWSFSHGKTLPHIWFSKAFVFFGMVFLIDLDMENHHDFNKDIYWRIPPYTTIKDWPKTVDFGLQTYIAGYHHLWTPEAERKVPP